MRIKILLNILIIFTYQNLKCQNHILSINSKTDTLFTNVLAKKADRYTILSNNWKLNYHRHSQIDLKVTEPDDYMIESICEDEEIGICLIDTNQNVIAVGNRPENRFHKRTISKKLEVGSYSLIIGSGTVEDKLLIKLAIHNKKTSVKWRNENLKNIDITKREIEGYIDSTSFKFEKKNTIIYRINLDSKKKYWYKIKCVSDDFSPFILGLNSSEEVEKAEYYDSDFKKFPEIIISNKDSLNYIIVGTNTKLDFKKKGKYEFRILCKRYSYNPSDKFIERIKNHLTPLTTFILGLIFAFIVSYYFYRKSIKSRKLSHWEISDNVLLSQDEKRKEHFLTIGEKSAYSASHFKYQFENVGRKRITREQIKNDIILELTNINEILDLNFNYVGEGWLIPEQIGKNSVKIDFKHIDSKDNIILSIICDVKIEQQKSKGIIPKVSGYISETEFYEKTNKPRSIISLLTHFINYLSIFILLPFILIVDYFDLSMPYWYNRFSVYYWPIAIFIMYIYLLTIGRDYLIKAPKILWFYIKKIAKTTANNV